MSTITLSRPLRLVLGADAATSAAAGLAMILGHQALAPVLGMPPSLLLACGFAFIPWALALGWLARRAHAPRSWVWAVVALNVVWVAESLSALALGWLQPTALGQAVVIAQAVGVLVLADLQGWLLWRRPAAGRLAAA